MTRTFYSAALGMKYLNDISVPERKWYMVCHKNSPNEQMLFFKLSSISIRMDIDNPIGLLSLGEYLVVREVDVEIHVK